MTSQWIIWCDCRDERKVRRVLDRVAEVLTRSPTNVSVDLDDGLYVVRFHLPVVAQTWGDMVLELIQIGYTLGDRWMIGPGTSSGSMCDAVEGYTSQLSLFRTAGVKLAHWHMENHETTNNA